MLCAMIVFHYNLIVYAKSLQIRLNLSTIAIINSTFSYVWIYLFRLERNNLFFHMLILFRHILIQITFSHTWFPARNQVCSACSQERMRRDGTSVAKRRRRNCAVGRDGCCCCCHRAADSLTAAGLYSTFEALAEPIRWTTTPSCRWLSLRSCSASKEATYTRR